MNDFITHIFIIAGAIIWLIWLFSSPRTTIFWTLTLGCGLLGSSAGFLGTCLGLVTGAIVAGLLFLLFWLIQQIPNGIERAKVMWRTTHGREELAGVLCGVTALPVIGLFLAHAFMRRGSTEQDTAYVALSLLTVPLAISTIACWLASVVRRISLRLRGQPPDPAPPPETEAPPQA